MYKTALAALSLALSFGLLTVPVSADDQSNQNSQGQGNNNQDSNGNGSGGNGSNGNGSGGNGTSGNNDSNGNGNSSSTVTNSKQSTTTSSSSTKDSSKDSTKDSAKDKDTSKSKAATTAPATPYVQTFTYSKSGKVQSTTTTMTSTGEQKSTSTATTTSAPGSTTKTASIGKTGTGKTDAKTTTTTSNTTTTVTKKTNKDDVVTLQESGNKKYLSTKKNTWQTFEMYINLKPGQQALPLTMTVTNEGYTGINMLLGGQKLATDKDFKGTSLRMQMTGALADGDNKLSVQGYGPVGANMSWKLTTTRPSITSIKPSPAGLDEEITITGKGFSKTPAGNFVYVDKKPALVKGGTSGKEIIFTLPKDAISGKTKLIVSVGGILSKEVELIIKGAPEVTGVDLLSGPPGSVLNITGKGFAASPSDNVVTIGGTPAQVSSGTKTNLTVTIPEMYYPQWGLAVVVKTGGVESKGTVKVNVQSRNIPNDGVPEQ